MHEPCENKVSKHMSTLLLVREAHTVTGVGSATVIIVSERCSITNGILYLKRHIDACVVDRTRSVFLRPVASFCDHVQFYIYGRRVPLRCLDVFLVSGCTSQL